MSAVEIEGYIAGLAAALRGPRRLRADLVAEARHSLIDATSAHQERGLPADAAARQAIEEFGGYPQVLPGYQAELAVAQGRRTALLIALALPALTALTPLMWWRSPWPASVAASPHYQQLAQVFDYLSISGGLLAALVLVGFGPGSRYIRDGMWLTRTLGRGTLGFLAVHGLAGAAIYLWSVRMWPTALHWPPMWLGAALLPVGFGYAALCGWRCLATSRQPAAAVA